MSGYVLTEAAEQDVLEIGRYIAADHPELAGRVIDDIEAAMRRLGEHPMLGHRRPDLTANPAYRFWPVRSYLVVYRPEPTPIRIARVVRAARDVGGLLP